MALQLSVPLHSLPEECPFWMIISHRPFQDFLMIYYAFCTHLKRLNK